MITTEHDPRIEEPQPDHVPNGVPNREPDQEPAELAAIHDFGAKLRQPSLVARFDAAHECREVTCPYNSANWFIEELIKNPEKLDDLLPAEERNDFFL